LAVELMDITSAAQRCGPIFTCGVTSSFEVYEELVLSPFKA